MTNANCKVSQNYDIDMNLLTQMTANMNSGMPNEWYGKCEHELIALFIELYSSGLTYNRTF